MGYSNEIMEAIKAAKKYKNRSSFQKYDFHNFNILKKNKLLDEIIPSTLPRITKERAYNIAKKYNTYSDFLINENKCYRKALHNGWIEEYTWLQRGVYDMETKNHIVYAYEISHLNSVYVGRTMRPTIRKRQHKTDTKDTLYKFISNNNLSNDKVIYKVLIDKLNASDSQYYEEYYINQYKENGWKLINKAKAGSLGGSIVKWDYDSCYKEALKYDNETDFRKCCSTASAKAVQMGWKKDYYWMKKYDPYVHYTYEECYEAAKQCNSLTSFNKCFSSQYRYSALYGFLEKFNWLYQKARYEPIVEYDLNGNFIKEYKNNDIKGINKRQSVLKCCENKLSYGYNRIWRFKSDALGKDGNIILKINGIKENGIPIVQYDSNGKYIQEFKSINEAAKSINCSSSSIFDALQGKKTILCYGYAWRYKKDILDSNGEIIKEVKLRKNNRKRRLVQYDEDGNLVNVYDSATIAYKEHTRHKVEWTLKDNWKRGKYGRSKLFFGYVWFYESEVLDERGEIKNKIDLD